MLSQGVDEAGVRGIVRPNGTQHHRRSVFIFFPWMLLIKFENASELIEKAPKSPAPVYLLRVGLVLIRCPPVTGNFMLLKHLETQVDSWFQYVTGS